MKFHKYILSCSIILCLLLSVTGCNHTKINNNVKSSSVESNITNNITVTKAYDFYDGFAWTVYTKDNIDYCGLINTDGKIIYSEQYNNKSNYCFYKMSGSLTYFSCDGTYTVINSEGNVVMSSENGDFDEVLAAGDSIALVYKYNGGVTTSEYLYGVIDSNGNWVQPLTDWGGKGGSFYSYSYAGDGMFASQSLGNNDTNIFIYNSKNNSSIALLKVNPNSSNSLFTSNQYSDVKSDFAFTNNVTFFSSSSNEFYPSNLIFSPEANLEINYDANDKEKIVTGYFKLNSDGTYNEISEYNYESEGKLFREKDGYLEIFDYADNSTAIITDYPSSMVTSIKFVDNYGLILLDGQDGNKYFTLIDENGKKLFEPKSYIIPLNSAYINYRSDKIVACVEKGIYNIYDQSGATLAEGLKYQTIDGFYDDIAVAVDEDGNSCYINSKGEKILTNLSE